jgi:hypothetical protein
MYSRDFHISKFSRSHFVETTAFIIIDKLTAQVQIKCDRALYQIRLHQNYSSLYSLPLCPLRPLWLNHSDPTGNDIISHNLNHTP